MGIEDMEPKSVKVVQISVQAWNTIQKHSGCTLALYQRLSPTF